MNHFKADFPVSTLTRESTNRTEGAHAPRAQEDSLYATLGAGRARSTLQFLVHAAMPELQHEAAARGWHRQGFTTLSIAWLELRWTSDGWRSTHVVSSNDVPCPVVNGVFHLTGCPKGTEVEFAIHVGLACHAPHDTAFARDVGDCWLNNEGRNFRQVTG